MGYDVEKEIPIQILQDSILKGDKKKSELLCMFCGVDEDGQREMTSESDVEDLVH